jgi:hypothetical protein
LEVGTELFKLYFFVKGLVRNKTFVQSKSFASFPSTPIHASPVQRILQRASRVKKRL